MRIGGANVDPDAFQFDVVHDPQDIFFQGKLFAVIEMMAIVSMFVEVMIHLLMIVAVMSVQM
ncbi:hypothetical protein BSNK01_26770 [Bacillaceae bacterium]